MVNQSSSGLASPSMQLLRTLVWGTLIASLLVGLLLVLQRLWGGAAQSIDPFAAMLVSALAVALAYFLRRQPANVIGSSVAERLGILLLPALCLFSLGIALTSPGLPVAALVIVWLLIAGEEGISLWKQREFVQEIGSRLRRQSRHGSRDQELGNRGQVTVDTEPDVLPEAATQSMLRTCDADGVEAVSGTLRADFAPGERTVYAHVGFCPQLPSVPNIEFEQTGGPDATIKLAHVLPHGARFDVRLQRASLEAERVEMAFHAVAAE